MRIGEVRGQPGAVRVLGRAIESGRVASAYLFSGPEGVGKRTLARAFAAALLCDAPAAGEACGACRSCKKLAHDTHPDLIVLATLPDKKEIAVEQIRTEVVSHMAYSPYESAHRLFLVPVADDLSLSAENALLRSMEEPGTHTHFVLVSSEAHRLLPTIRSRCQEIRFVSLADALVVELLAARGVAVPDARRAAAFAGGSVGRAIRLLEGDLASHVAVAEALDAAATQGLPAILELAAKVAKERKGSLAEVLEAWILLRRDVLRAAEGAPDEALLVATDPALLRRRAEETTPEARVRALESVHGAIMALERYANAELVLDRAMLEVGR